MKALINNVMEVVHDQSLPTIGLLQTSFPDNKDFMINISTLFDPRYVFLIYAPILFAFNKRVGHRMIIALTLAEWSNQILKWLLAGERPYWYVHERANELANFTTATNGPPMYHQAQQQHQHQHQHQHQQAGGHLYQLKQFPVTCELGAGSPSGHSMVTATVWYILIDAYLKGELILMGRPDYSQLKIQSAPATASVIASSSSHLKSGGDTLARVFWSMYTLMLVLVSLSRVYLACHFPHQCIAGALLGCLLARLVAEKLPMEQLGRAHFSLTTCLMFASALATYGLLRMTGFDPLWSVTKAMRWCVKKEYIHLDTTPFFSMMRYLGFCLGVGLAYDSDRLISSTSSSSSSLSSSSTTSTSTKSATATKLSQSQSQSQAPTNLSLLARRLLASLMAIAFGQFLLALPAPKSNLNLFYVISFVIYTLFSYAIAGPIPALAKRLMPATNVGPCQDQSATKIKAN